MHATVRGLHNFKKMRVEVFEQWGKIRYLMTDYL